MMNATRNSLYASFVRADVTDAHLVFQKADSLREKGSRFRVAGKPRIRFVDRVIDREVQSKARSRSAKNKRILTPGKETGMRGGNGTKQFTSRKGRNNGRSK